MPTITRTAASLIGIVAAFALVLYLAYGGSGDDSDATPTPTPSPIVRTSTTATPLVTASPSPIPRPLPPVLEGPLVGTLEVRSLVQFPRDTALILETGCWQCDGPSTGLRRMYKDPDDELRIEQLLSFELLGLADSGAYFTGYAIAPDASYMLASVCLQGGCAYGLSGWTADARTAIYESTDGGITWHLLEESDHGFTVHGLVGWREALVSWQTDEVGTRVFALYPGLEVIVPPDDGSWPALTVDGEVLWQVFDRPQFLLRTDGSIFVDFGEETHIRPQYSWPSFPQDLVPVAWSWLLSQEPQEYLSLVDRFGRITAGYELNPPSAWMLSAIARDGQIYGTMADPPLIGSPPGFLGLLPAILDLRTGRYNNIKEPFLDEDYDRQRDIVRAVQLGDLARVAGVEGSCLNVRSHASADASVLECAAEGVLLRSFVIYGDWASVFTPNGHYGFAATEFLEY